MLMDVKGEKASETSSLLIGTEIDFKLDLKLEFKPSTRLIEPPKEGKLHARASIMYKEHEKNEEIQRKH